jgi:Tol biopolymer transport system component
MARRVVAPLAALLAAFTAARAPGAGTLHDPREMHLAEVRQLTSGGDNAEGYWSFGGDRLIFQSTRPPFGCDQIFTLRVSAPGEPQLVSSGRGRTTCGFFLPGDRRVLWAATDAYADACPAPPDFSQGYVWPVDADYEIFAADADGGNRARLTENRAYDAEATVCAATGAIVFTSTRDGDLDLYRMDADGSNVRRLTSTPGYDGGAVFSPDCSKIAWRASRPAGPELDDYRRLLAQGLVRPSRLELWVAAADGSDARQITDLGVASFAPAFFPSGERIVFSSNRGDPGGREFDLWAIDVDGTDLERITYTPSFDGFPMFSPDGNFLAFASNRNQAKPGETDLYVAQWIDAPPARTVERAADRFAADAAWLADDAREGRGVGTAGLAAAGEWLERRFAEIGLAPAGANGFRQELSVEVAVRSGEGTRLELDGRSVAAERFVPASFSSPGPAEGEVVLAGWGISAPEKGHDDYAGVDVEGRIVLVRRFVPETEPFASNDDQRRWGDLRYKAFAAREHGAIGLLVADLGGGKDPGEAPLPNLAPEPGGDAGIPVAVVARALAEPLLAGGHRARLAVDLRSERAAAFNVLGRLDPPSTPPDERVIVVGAHYDHLGRGGGNSLAPGSTEIHNGADDNASGVAALLEAARTLAVRRHELSRPIVFAAFTGEERGLLGSNRFVRQPPGGLSIPRFEAMINLDMVGRLRGETLTVGGVDTAEEWATDLETACRARKLDCKASPNSNGPSDHTSFAVVGVPVLFLFTGNHDQYHKPSDDAPLLNATGGAKIAALVADLALAGANRERPLTSARRPRPELPRGDVRGSGASLGTVPDYAGPGEGKSGVLLAGVRPGGPAETAGLRRGDLVVGLAGKQIRSVEDLMFVLRQAKPGEATTVVIVRDGERLELPAVFGEAVRRN